MIPDSKLQAAFFAGLFVLAGLATVGTPATAQVPNPEDCLDGAIGPFPAPDPTCLDDAGLPEGCDPASPGFPQEACGVPVPGLDALCALGEDPEGTFPTCMGTPGLEALDALCGLPGAADPEGAFPTCLGTPGLEALDGLCAINPEAADPTFPGCLSDFGPGGLPEGCDPAGPGFPQEACGIPAPGLEALDGLCALGEDPEGTFPTCLGTPGLEALDGLCAINPEAADPTFPGCLSDFGPGGLPEGCDPAGPGFPQEACGIPAPGLEALDALCGLPGAADPEGAFPTCLGTPGLEALDGLCALSESPEGTFPACFGTPGGLPEGCDPAGPGFPQEACGIPAPGLEALDAFCVLGDAEGTFPTCLADVGGLDALCALPVVGDPEGTFPTCLAAVPGLEALDALCALGQDPEGTFPTCIGTPGLEALDGLCALPVSEDPEGTFPACFGTPGGLPEGCDPAGAGFPQAECGLPPVDPSAIDELCVILEMPGTFPTCLLGAAPSNNVPVADAGADQGVDEGDLVTLDGTGSSDADDDPLTYAWVCDAGITLSNASVASPSFDAPEVSTNTVYECLLTVDDGTDSSSPDSVNITVNNVLAALAIDVGLSSLASQDAENIVEFVGTATLNRAADDVLVSISNGAGWVACEPPASGSAVFWSNDSPTKDLDSGANAFTVQVCNGGAGEVTFTVNVSAEDTFDVADITITFDGAGTPVEVNVADVAAALAAGEILLDGIVDSVYAPDGAATPVLSSLINITDGNGHGLGNGNVSNGRINDDNLQVSLARGADSAALANGAGSIGSNVAWLVDSSTTLPANLKDGAYTLTANYTNLGVGLSTADATRSLVVDNAAPSIAVVAGEFAGTQRVADSDTVSVTLRDANIGTLGGGSVTELGSLALSVRDSASCTVAAPTAAILFAFANNATGSVGSASSLSFADALLSGGQTVFDLTVSWTASLPADTYFICGSLTDDDGASSGQVLLATLELVALNGGFHLTVDDGGDGLDVATPIVPGGTASTEALRVLFSGTEDANNLTLSVSQFVSNFGDTFDAESLTATLCLESSCAASSIIGNATAVGGVLTFDQAPTGDLTGVLTHGVPFFVVIGFTVPEGTAAGSYSSAVAVSAEPA